MKVGCNFKMLVILGILGTQTGVRLDHPGRCSFEIVVILGILGGSAEFGADKSRHAGIRNSEFGMRGEGRGSELLRTLRTWPSVRWRANDWIL
jgi:hypothetical protein